MEEVEVDVTLGDLQVEEEEVFILLLDSEHLEEEGEQHYLKEVVGVEVE